ncbi:hypothetical protein F5883DRAFT_631123 [Diaporthe sp. PMI_573]|nr:hypothetical protein F5883DRAFT_631123 [Diaporthaceae sp. PMI_573]
MFVEGNEQARGEPKPYASNRDLWTEALKSLKEPERHKDIVAIVAENFAAEPDRDSANKPDVKSLAEDIEKKIYNEVKDRQHDSKTRRILENAVSVLNKFACAVDVVASFDPVHAALPWAAVRSVLVVLTAYNELKSQLLTGIAKVASLLVQCDTYQQLYMAPDPALRPPEAALEKLKTSIVQAYATSQLFLGFAIQRHRSKTKMMDAPFKLGDVESCVQELSKSEGQLLQAADDCGKHCGLSNRAKSKELLELATSFHQIVQIVHDQVQLVLERIDDEDQLKILEWICPIPHGKHHDTVQMARTSGTCEWLLQHKRFCEWKNTSSSVILWLQGSPGTGKTFLTSKAIDYVQSELKSSANHEGFAFFYCNWNEEERRKPLTVLRSYVRQLSTTARNPGHIRKHLRDLSHEKRRKGSDLNLEDCKGQLLESVNLYPKTTLVVDALDECEPESRLQLVEVLHDLLSKSVRPLKVFISSRPDVDIRAHFTSHPNIKIQARDNQGDIEIFVNKEMNKPRRWGPISSPLRREIVKILLERSQGIRLGELPSGLKEAYDRIYNEIAKHDHAKDLVDRACMWVMSARTRLGSEELLSAIRVSSDPDTIDLADKMTESYLQDLSSNLLVLDSQWKIWRFSHFSVAEYFEKNHWTLLQAHCQAAKVCLKLLIETYKEPRSGRVDSSVDKRDTDSRTRYIFDPKHPFQKYCRHQWIKHVQTQEGHDADPVLAGLLKTFLGSPQESSLQYRQWYRRVKRECWNPYMGRQNMGILPCGINVEEVSPENAAILAMCRFSFYTLLLDWWESAVIALSQKNSRGDNLLTLAVAAGSKPVCELLIKRGMHVNMQNGAYSSALAAASYLGRIKIVDALAAAAAQGQTQPVKFLIQEGANVNMLLQSGDYGSALAAAAAQGTTHTVEFLVQQGTDINMLLQSGDYGSALAAVKFLLVQHESDLRIAQDPSLCLVPPDITWEQFCDFTSSLIKHPVQGCSF